MGYGFIGKRLKNDEEDIFYTSCMYAYQSVFRECFGKEITEFNGRVTKEKLKEFRTGLNKFTDSKFNLDHKQMIGYLDNATHKELVNDLLRLCNLMESKEVKYLSIA